MNGNLAYDGQCAFALSTGKAGVEAREDLALVQGDVTYRFSNPVAKILWRILPGRQAKADATFAATKG